MTSGIALSIFFRIMYILIANLMVPNAKQGLTIISVPNIKIILHRDGFPSLDEGYDVMKSDNKSG